MSGLTRWAIAGEPTLANIWHALLRLSGNLGRTPVYHGARIVATSGAVLDSDEVLQVATAGGAVTLDLPPAKDVLGRRFTFWKADASANNLTLDGFDTETINGAATLAWNTQNRAYEIQACLLAAPATFGWIVTADKQ